MFAFASRFSEIETMGSRHLKSVIPADVLRHHYEVEQLTDKQIAEQYGASPEGLRLYRLACGIPTNPAFRTRNRRKYRKGEPMTATELKRLYCKLGWSDEKISLRFDVDRTTVRDRRHVLGIFARPKGIVVTTGRQRKVAASKATTRRARERAAPGSHTRAEWRARLIEYKNSCAYCRRQVPLTKDHVVPLAIGGSKAISNIVPSCLRCNTAKGTAVWQPLPPLENH